MCKENQLAEIGTYGTDETTVQKKYTEAQTSEWASQYRFWNWLNKSRAKEERRASLLLP